VVAIGKAAFYRQLQMPQPLAYDYAQDVMTMNAGGGGRAGRDEGIPGEARAEVVRKVSLYSLKTSAA